MAECQDSIVGAPAPILRRNGDVCRYKDITCEQCGAICPGRGPLQRYCLDCSQKRAAERKERHRNSHPNYRPAKRASQKRLRSRMVLNGEEINRTIRWGVNDLFPDETGMVWIRRVQFPFMQALSKNYFYSQTDRGHVALRQDNWDAKELIRSTVLQAISDVRVARNKLWLDILIQKPNARIDAINFLDHIADAIKKAVGLDDQWFSIRRIDWQLTKINPMIFLGIGQDTIEDIFICAHCGRGLTFGHFWKNKSSKTGHSRACKDCMKGRIRPQS